MAERSMAPSAGAGWADFSKASNCMGMPDGDFSSPAARGTKEKPEIAPLTLRVTRAVTCSHHGLLMGCTGSPRSSPRLGLVLPDQVAISGTASAASLWQVSEDRLDLWTGRVSGVLEQRGRVLGRPRAGAYHPPLIDIGHQRGLPRRSGNGPSAQARKALVRGDLARSGVAEAIRRVAFQPFLDDRPAVGAGHGGPADDVVDRPGRHLDAVDRVGRVVGVVEVQRPRQHTALLRRDGLQADAAGARLGPPWVVAARQQREYPENLARGLCASEVHLTGL